MKNLKTKSFFVVEGNDSKIMLFYHTELFTESENEKIVSLFGEALKFQTKTIPGKGQLQKGRKYAIKKIFRTAVGILGTFFIVFGIVFKFFLEPPDIEDRRSMLSEYLILFVPVTIGILCFLLLWISRNKKNNSN